MRKSIRMDKSKMNIKEIDERYITKKENDSFYTPLTFNKGEPLFEEAKEATGFDYKKMEEWVANKFGFNERHRQNYIMDGIGYSGEVKKENADYLGLLQFIPNGLRYDVEYKKVKLSFDVLPDGTIAKAIVIHDFFGTLMQGYISVRYTKKTLDEYYDFAISEIKKDKRRIMTNFNKLIKETKAEYRDRLSKVNEVLKGAK